MTSRPLRRLAPGIGRWVPVALLVGLAGWLLHADSLAPFGRLSWLAYDAILQWQQPAERIDARVVIVDIDDASLQRHGRWPWPRDLLVELIDAIQAAEPAVIGLDILLPEATLPESDSRLARRLAAPNLVTATAYGGVRASGSLLAYPRAEREVVPSSSLYFRGQPPLLGHITPQLEDDGRIRRFHPYIIEPDGEPRATLALAMLEVWLDLPAHRKRQPDGEQLCVASFCQSTAREQGLLIPYHHASRFEYLSAQDVMSGQHRERIAGKLVLVGTSAVGLGDLVVTPRDPLTPGVELHAVLLAGWLDSLGWRPLPFTTSWRLLGLAVLGSLLLVGFHVPGTGSRYRKLLLVVMALMVVTPLLLVARGWWLDPWAWWGSVMAVVLVWLGWERWFLWRRHHLLYRRFGSYVPHSILRQLIEEHGEESFTPQRRPLVIMFCDIRGFTEISERLPPESLVHFTNHIFTELTQVVHAHGGTLDKYIGDALMAFWGAPLRTAHDAQRAVACASALHKALEELNRWAAIQAYPPITLHIGLEAGEVTVGNLGSRQRLAYTALGRAVNLAARLEEKAGSLGEPTLLGPGVVAALQGKSVAEYLEPLGHISLKGVSQPVPVWRLVSHITAKTFMPRGSR